jgi:hypothetical protein
MYTKVSALEITKGFDSFLLFLVRELLAAVIARTGSPIPDRPLSIQISTSLIRELLSNVIVYRISFLST